VKAPGADRANNFEYRGWLVHIGVHADGTCFNGEADVSIHGQRKALLTLPLPCRDAVAAVWALDSLARNFIDEKCVRPPPVPPGFEQEPE
jgi:hypothetical protein